MPTTFLEEALASARSTLDEQEQAADRPTPESSLDFLSDALTSARKQDDSPPKPGPLPVPAESTGAFTMSVAVKSEEHEDFLSKALDGAKDKQLEVARQSDPRFRITEATAELDARSTEGFDDLTSEQQLAAINKRRQGFGLPEVRELGRQQTLGEFASEDLLTTERIPFAGSAFLAADLWRVHGAAQRAENDQATPEDFQLLAEFQEDLVKQARGKTVPARIADTIATSVPFFAEFFVSGGVLPAAKAGAKKAAKAVVKRSFSKAIAGLARSTGRLAADSAKRLPFFSTRIAEGTVRGLIPHFSVEPDGEDFQFIVRKEGKGFGEALKDASIDIYVEIFSEQTGQVFAVLGRPIKAGARKLGIPPLRQGAREFLSRAGFSSIIGEVGEERIGELLREAATRVGAADLPQEFPTAEQVGIETAAFGILGAGVRAGSALGGERPPPQAPQEPVGEPPTQPVAEQEETSTESAADVPVPPLVSPEGARFILAENHELAQKIADIKSPTRRGAFAELKKHFPQKEVESTSAAQRKNFAEMVRELGTQVETTPEVVAPEDAPAPPADVSRETTESAKTAQDEVSDAEFRQANNLITGIKNPKDVEPLLRALFPDFTEVEEAEVRSDDFAFGIHRMANRGDEIHRVPTVDLTKRIRDAKERGVFDEALRDSQERVSQRQGDIVEAGAQGSQAAVAGVQPEAGPTGLAPRQTGIEPTGAVPARTAPALPAKSAETAPSAIEPAKTGAPPAIEEPPPALREGTLELARKYPGQIVELKKALALPDAQKAKREDNRFKPAILGKTAPIPGEFSLEFHKTRRSAAASFDKQVESLIASKERFLQNVEDAKADIADFESRQTGRDALQPAAEPDEIFIRPAKKNEVGVARTRAMAQLPPKPGFEVVYKPFGVDGKGFYYVSTDPVPAEAAPDTSVQPDTAALEAARQTEVEEATKKNRKRGLNVKAATAKAELEVPKVEVAVPAPVAKAPSSTLSQKAKESTKALDNTIAELGKFLEGRTFANPLDPELLKLTGKLVKDAVKAGVLNFADLTSRVAKQIGASASRHLEPALRRQWNAIHKKDDGPSDQAGEPSGTSIKNAVVDQEREKRGLQPAMSPARKSFGDVWDEAMRIVDEQPSVQDALIFELANKSRPVSDIEDALLLHRQVALQNEYDKTLKLLDRAGDDASAASLKAQEEVLLAELEQLYDINKGVGTATARGLNARKLLAAEDFSLVRMLAMKRKAKDVAKLSSEDAEAVKKAQRELAEVDKKLRERTERLDEREARLAIEQSVKKIVSSEKKLPKKKRTAGAKAELEVAWKDFESKIGGKLFANPLDPELIVSAAKLARAYINLGVATFQDFLVAVKDRVGSDKANKMRDTLSQAWKKEIAKDLPQARVTLDEPGPVAKYAKQLAKFFASTGVSERNELIDLVHAELVKVIPDITRRQTMDAISGYGEFSPLSQESLAVLLRDLKGQMQQIAKLEDMQAGQAPLKTGVERRSPSTEERQLIQQVNEMKKRGGFEVTDPETQLQSALGAVKTRLRNQIADLETQIAAKEKIVKKRTDTPQDEEVISLVKQRDKLRKVFDEIFGKPERTNEQLVAAATSAARRSIAELERRIAEKDISSARPRSKLQITRELQSLRDRRDALRAELQELRDLANPKKTPEERALSSLKTRLRTRIADYQDRLARGDFAPKKRNETTLDKEAETLRFQAEQAKKEFLKGLRVDARKRRTALQKIGGFVAEVLNTSRAILVSMDLSAVFRQGGVIVFGNPVRGARALGDMFRAFASKAASSRALEAINQRPNAKLYKRAGLDITDPEGSLSQQEELYMAEWSKVIPLVAGSERAFSTYLNRIRVDTFDALAASLGRNGSLSEEEAKVIANYVNVATGRGNLGKLKAASSALATVFFAPKYVASRFQYLGVQPLRFKGNTLATRKLIVLEYAKTITGLGLFFSSAYLALYALLGPPGDDKEWNIELDSRSSDFGKIRIGKTRIDPLVGMQQPTVLLSRLITGETKRLKSGDIVPIRGEDVPFGGSTGADVIARFARTKLSPIIGTAINVVSGENVIGEPVTAKTTARDMVVPISLREIGTAMKEHGVPVALGLQLLETFGMSVQIHDDLTLQRAVRTFERFDAAEKTGGSSKPRLIEIGKLAYAVGATKEADPNALKTIQFMDFDPGEVRTGFNVYWRSRGFSFSSNAYSARLRRLFGRLNSPTQSSAPR